MTSRHWLVVGNYGAHNCGDEAMLAGLLEGLAGEHCTSVHVVSKTGRRPAWMARPSVHWIPPRVVTVLGTLRACQGLILGGGTHFHDDYRVGRLVRHWWYLTRILLLSLAARALRKRVVWLGVGVGPVSGRVVTLLSRMALSTCDAVTVRDRRSFDLVRRLAPAVPLVHAFDLSALLPPAAPRGEGTRARLLGISVTGIANTRNGSRTRDVDAWAAFADGVALALVRDAHLRIRLLTIRGGTREDDTAVTWRVHDRLAAVDARRVEIVPYDSSPYAMFQHVAECDGFVGARYHASMLACLAGVPQIVLAYHQKCVALAEEIGLGSHALLDIRCNPDPLAVGQRVLDLIERPETYLPAMTIANAREAAMASIAVLASVDRAGSVATECAASS